MRRRRLAPSHYTQAAYNVGACNLSSDPLSQQKQVAFLQITIRSSSVITARSAQGIWQCHFYGLHASLQAPSHSPATTKLTTICSVHCSEISLISCSDTNSQLIMQTHVLALCNNVLSYIHAVHLNWRNSVPRSSTTIESRDSQHVTAIATFGNGLANFTPESPIQPC